MNVDPHYQQQKCRPMTLVSGNINYFRRIPTYVLLIPKRHRQTQGQTDGRLTVALPCSALASRGNNTSLHVLYYNASFIYV